MSTESTILSDSLNPFSILRSMSLFTDVADKTLHYLINGGQVVHVAAGDYFFREGSPAADMFLLKTGRAAVVKSWRGRGYVLKEFDPGQVFGEMALLDLRPRSASIRALEPCSALAVSRAALDVLAEGNLAEYTQIQVNLGREVCQRLRETDKLLFQNMAEHQQLTRPEPVFQKKQT